MDRTLIDGLSVVLEKEGNVLAISYFKFLSFFRMRSNQEDIVPRSSHRLR